MIKEVKSLLTEYGVKWAINRSFYSAKLKMLSAFPATEKIFEKNVKVKRIDLFEFDVPAIKNFLDKLTEDKQKEIVLVADKAVNGIITGFSSIKLDFGNPINWHYNPLTGVESKKNVKWYHLPDFDKDLGDIKVIWEASRLTHFFYLVRAYLLTDDQKYYIAFSKQLEDWLENNPYPYGVNFKCGQECTLRMVNTLIAYSIFKDCGLTSKNDKENVIQLVERCYKKVLSNFFYAHKCIKNNHTFSEICGLIVGAWCCDDTFAVKKAYELLDKEIINQFEPDGGFTQYSFNYHRFTLQIIECVYKISEKTKIYIKETERIKNSVLLMYQAQNDDGDVPNYGSNDGALIFPVTSCGYRDFRPVLNTMYAFVEGKRLYEDNDYDEELLWFGNKKELPLEKIKRKTSIFADSGFYIFRHNGGFLMTCLQNYKSRPAHMDQLHIDLWHKGINVLCDSGTYSYASELGKDLSSTKGHNTAKIKGIDQMNKKGAFLVTDWTKIKHVNFQNNCFVGTMNSINGYQHKRIIEKNKLGYTVVDEVIGNGEYCEFYFHTPCEVKRISTGFELYHEGQIICIIETEGAINIKKSYRSLYYLKKEKVKCVSVKIPLTNDKFNVKTNINLIS
ncbi:heparinase II/III domain-containing protein [Heliorestis convoluta]|uniref:Alginate lyase family protein, putative n=1 Tax=Heliorestis convoluta TaxID=356322 RepID=A0A5Q2N1Y4_9FIRM|nr:heparinase II/III family protein [Heliorestis convoluta]QGG47302.1 alginate lyase family protein, putative [Heliorestis convoluta]